MSWKRFVSTGSGVLAFAAMGWMTAPSSAALVGFDAEDTDSRSSTEDVGYVNRTDSTAIGQTAINYNGPNVQGGDVTATYSVSIPEDDDYDLYGRVRQLSGGDSFFTPDALGSSPSFIRTNSVPVDNANEWINLSENPNMETSLGDDTGPDYDGLIAGGKTFIVGAREADFQLDAFAFGSDDANPTVTGEQDYTSAQLTAAVPEPATAGLVLLGAGLMLARRRRA